MSTIHCPYCRTYHARGQNCAGRERVMALIKNVSEEQNNGVMISQRQYDELRRQHKLPLSQSIARLDKKWSDIAQELGLILNANAGKAGEEHFEVSAKVVREISAKLYPDEGIACSMTEYDEHRGRCGELSGETIRKRMTWQEFIHGYTDLQLMQPRFYKREGRLRRLNNAPLTPRNGHRPVTRHQYQQAMDEQYSDGMPAKQLKTEEFTTVYGDTIVKTTRTHYMLR